MTMERRYNRKCPTCGHRFSVLATMVWNPEGRTTAPAPYFGGHLAIEFMAEGRSFAPSYPGDNALRYRCPCGRWLRAEPVRGKIVKDKKCDSRCTFATGHNCECSCGGKNHGSDHG